MAQTLEELGKIVQELKDRQEIYDCLTRYARGVDRLDREMVLSAYHPDAVDDHGKFVGTRDDFVEWAFPQHIKAQYATQHCLFNHRCEIEGAVAHTETYYMFVGMNKSGKPCGLNGGRYVDRLEKRDGEWRIAARHCIRDWTLTDKPIDITDISQFSGTNPPEAFRALMNAGPVAKRDKSDASYQRPLRIDPERVAAYKALTQSTEPKS